MLLHALQDTVGGFKSRGLKFRELVTKVSGLITRNGADFLVDFYPPGEIAQVEFVVNGEL